MSLLDNGAVTIADYRVQTGDTTSPSANVSSALLEAQSILEDHLRRHLDNAQRTERTEIYMDGRVYPSAYPITAASAGIVVDGRSLWGVQPDTGPFIGIFEQTTPLRATITWTGGYTNAAGAAPFPRTLAHALYDLAKGLLTFSDTPAGVKSASVGDTSVQYAQPTSGGIDSIAPGLSARVKPYKNRYMAAGGTGVAARVLTP